MTTPAPRRPLTNAERQARHRELIKIEREYLRARERELETAFLSYVQVDNGCAVTGKTCREREQCGCYMEMLEWMERGKQRCHTP